MMSVHLALSLVISLVPAASQDGNIEWNGVSHIDWMERTPICPVGGESFTITFQTFHFDITSARVNVSDGVTVWVPASFSHQRGPYDVWTATIPATAANSLAYYIELTDGADVDYYSTVGMTDNPPLAGQAFMLDYTTISHAPIGATLTSDGGAAFKVWAPTATTVTLRGAFNNWAETLMNTDGNFWWIHLPGGSLPVSASDEYKFYFADRITGGFDPWQRDTRDRSYAPNSSANSIVIDSRAFAWNDAAFTPPPFEEMIIYEMHVGTFSGNNDGLNRMGRYRDVVDTHIDHLKKIGVNAVELMPVHEFDGFNSWGYNPTNVFGVEESYAESPQTGPDDFKYMVDKLHQAGIAVLTDIVFNHFSPSGNYLWCYDSGQDFFDGDCISGFVDTPWGAQADFDRNEVRDYYADSVLFWMDEYHVDGFRMDATQFMRDSGQFPLGQPSGWTLMQRVNDNIDNRAVDKISIAEELPDTTAVTNAVSAGGAGFDAQWHDQFVDTVRAEVLATSFGDPNMTAIKTAIEAGSFPVKPNLVRYVESHDEAGNGTRLPRAIDNIDPQSVFAKGRSKMALGLTMTTPGIPMYFMGSEWLEEDTFDSQFANRLDWSKATTRSGLVQFFADLASIRRSNCALRADSGFQVHHLDDTANVLAMQRFDLSGDVMVIVASLNNNDISQRIGFPQAGTWYEILNSQALIYDGNGTGNFGQIVTEPTPWDGMSQSAMVTVPQMGFLVFRFNDPAGRSADLNGDATVDLFDYAILQQRVGDQGCGMSADLLEDGRIDAGDLGVLVNSITGP